MSTSNIKYSKNPFYEDVDFVEVYREDLGATPRDTALAIKYLVSEHNVEKDFIFQRKTLSATRVLYFELVIEGDYVVVRHQTYDSGEPDYSINLVRQVVVVAAINVMLGYIAMQRAEKFKNALGEAMRKVNVTQEDLIVISDMFPDDIGQAYIAASQ